MTPTLDVQPLPYNRRKYLFLFLLSLFLLVLPVFMFYAMGYRLDLSSELRNFVGTGGMYVTTQNSDASIYLDDELVRNMRIFRSASYIQNLDEGVHTVTVQLAGYDTWTKDLPVFPHIVTEVQSFNLPSVPQIRLLTPYQTSARQAVIVVASTSDAILPFASTTNPVLATTSAATSTYFTNVEYEYVKTLFASSTASSPRPVPNDIASAFQFISNQSTTSPAVATSTKSFRDVLLYRQGDEVFARWVGSQNSTPYYYCIDHVAASSTRSYYGEHVYEAIAPILSSTSSKNVISRNGRTLVCRSDIRLDRKWQQVRSFDFLPGSMDHVLLTLEDGLYVGEIDDRAWQNTQLLYPGRDLELIVDGGQIYIKDKEYYLEVLTEIPN